jgi:hypothetical protein
MALSPLVESSLVLHEEWWTEKGKLIFLMPKPAAIYIDFGATSEIFPLSMQAQVEALYRESIL